MKKILFVFAVALFSMNVCAQGEWEKPNSNVSAQKKQGGLLDRNKKADKTIDPKYMEGAVPVVDGKVIWERTYSVEGKSASQIYDTLLQFFAEFVKEEPQTDMSQVAVVNKTQHQIGVRAQEWLVFENKPLSLDRTKFNYTLVANCEDGKVALSITHVSYKYEEDRPSAMTVTAEEWITDDIAINKKKNTFNRGGVKKFRMKTIDRVDEIFKQIGNHLGVMVK